MLVPLRVRDEEIGRPLRSAPRPFEPADVARGDRARRLRRAASENARLLAEAQVREAERARLADQVLTAEQDERRRLALFLHDGAVQSMSGVALMLDGGLHAAKPVRGTGDDRDPSRARARIARPSARCATSRSTSSRSSSATRGSARRCAALAEQLGLEHKIQIDVDVEAGETLGEKAQAALYQIIREALHGSIRRGPPTRIAVRVSRTDDGGLETMIVDDAPGERRARTYEAIEERARTLNGTLRGRAPGDDSGTTVRGVAAPLPSPSKIGARWTATTTANLLFVWRPTGLRARGAGGRAAQARRPRRGRREAARDHEGRASPCSRRPDRPCAFAQTAPSGDGLGRDEAEHERLRQAARVAAARDAADVDTRGESPSIGEPSSRRTRARSSIRRPPSVCVTAACTATRRAERTRPAASTTSPPASRAALTLGRPHASARPSTTNQADPPGSRDRLRQVDLVPRGRTSEELRAGARSTTRARPPYSCARRHEVGLADPRGRRGITRA